MRLFFVSDLHVDVPGNEPFVRSVAALAADEKPDVIVVAGDVCNGPARLEETLAWFRPHAPHALFVPGNHDLWTLGESESARDIYYRTLPRVAAAAGFTSLATEPMVLGSTAFVGTMAWYDYSFADPADGFTDDQLRSKIRNGMQWMDARFVRWVDGGGVSLSDADVTELMCEDLRDQLDAVTDDSVDKVILVTHHLPDVRLSPPSFYSERLAFFRSFLGSNRFAQICGADPRVTLALAGHVHAIRSVQLGGLAMRTCPVGYPKDRVTAVEPSERRLLIDV